MMSYAPSLVISFGFERLQANAMTSIGAWILLVTNISWGMISDKIGRRGPMVTLGILILWGTTVCCFDNFKFALFVWSIRANQSQLANRLLVESKNSNLRFGFLTLAIAFSAPWRKSSSL